jgi:hypothetical protein
MDFGKSFSYVFEDKEWVTKLLIGGLLSLIPIVNLVVAGYMIKVLKNVADGSEQPLPTWDNFGDYFVQGLKVTAGAFVWAIPMIAISIVTTVISAISGGDVNSSQQVSGPLTCCMWGLSCVSGLYGLLMGVFFPAAMTFFALDGQFSSMFKFRGIWSYVKDNLGNYVIALLLTGVASLAAGLGLILCFIGVIFTQFWSTLVTSHLLGQVYRQRTLPPIIAEPPLPVA